jgi:thiol-disulfide isomerase/thioredoxin
MRPPIAKRLLTALFSFGVLLAVSISAQAAQPFNAKAFADAQAAGKTILIDVWASWCPTCRKQGPILDSVARERPNLVTYRVDFDAQKDVLKQFRVQSQSTLIVFKGSNEIGRSTGDTNADSIRALVAKGF